MRYTPNRELRQIKTLLTQLLDTTIQNGNKLEKIKENTKETP